MGRSRKYASSTTSSSASGSTSDGSDLQSWNEVPSIAHFCSLFRQAFDLLEFDIQELEESLLLMGSDDDSSQLVQRLVIRLLKGCSKTFTNNINEDNFNTYLRRLFLSKREDAEEDNLEFYFDCKALLDDDVDFQLLSLRNRVRILHQLCEFRLDAEDVFEKLKNLDAESLRVDPLGKDAEGTTYWYFYGTRLYKEECGKIDDKKKRKEKKKKKKKDKKKKKKKSARNAEVHSASSDVDEDEDEGRSQWSVACLTLRDWEELTDKYKKSKKKSERELYETLSESFLPEIVKMFAEKEREERRRVLMLGPKRTSSRIERKRQDQEERDRLLAQKLEEERRIEEEYDEKLRIEREKREEDERERGREERLKAREAMKELRAQRVVEREVDPSDELEERLRKREDPSYAPSAADSDDSKGSNYSSENEPKSKQARTNFTNALLRVGTRSTRDSTLDKPVRKSPGLLLETAGRSLLQRANNSNNVKLKSGPTVGGLSFDLASSKISFGLYGGHLPVDHGSYTKSDSEDVANEPDLDVRGDTEDGAGSKFEATASKSEAMSKRQKVFSNWGGEFFKKNLDYRANTNKILEKMNLKNNGEVPAPTSSGLKSLVKAGQESGTKRSLEAGGSISPAKRPKTSFFNS